MGDRYLFGKWTDGGPITAADAVEICRAADSARLELASYPLDNILRLLDEVRKLWLDPEFEPRRRLEERLPEETGFSPAMVRLGLEELAWTFDPELLRKKMMTELGSAGRDCRWQPLGTILHVLAGNVFVGAAGSLVEGLITRNVGILKMSSQETIFLPELVRTIRALDQDGVVSRSLAVIEFGSPQKDVMDELKKRVDGVVVWGGEEAVRGWRDGLPARTKLIVFGPKLSAAVVTARGLAALGTAHAAQKLADEISIWDQNACTAPQVCYVEGPENARALAEAMPAALEESCRKLPPGRAGADAAVEIQKLRSVFEIAEARGEGLLRQSAGGVDWTVAVDPDPALEPSPLHRTIRLIPFAGIDEPLRQLEDLRGYIQTIGLAAADDEFNALSGRLAEAGALRILPLGSMAWGEIDDPHDGAYDLPQFLRLVVSRGPRADREASAGWSEAERRRIVDERLRTLIDRARRSPYYGGLLARVKIEGVGDLVRVPILTRELMESNMPPQGEGLSTGPWTGGYVTRSGGSTGAPKFSIYDKRDWDEMIGHAADLFKGLGLSSSDRLGNFMLAGDLYGSFVSFDHINAKVGAATFAFAGGSQPETFVDVWRKFKLNAVEGIPSSLIPFLRRAKELAPDLSLEKLIYAGSPLSPSDRNWLVSELGVKRIASVIGANDGGQFAFQCEKMEGAFHHTIDDYNWLEVVDDAGRPAPDGEVGRILITSLLKFAYPLIRYAIGDQGRIVAKPCACGRSARVLEYLGRADDQLTVGLLNVRHRDFASALEGLPISTLQLAAKNEKGAEFMVVRVETERLEDGLKERIESRLLKTMEKLRERLEEGSLSKVDIELYRPGQLPRNPRSGKIKSMVDERS